MSTPLHTELVRAACSYCHRVDEWYLAWAVFRYTGGSEQVTQKTAPPHLQAAHDAMMAAFDELHSVALGTPRPDYAAVARKQLDL